MYNAGIKSQVFEATKVLHWNILLIHNILWLPRSDNV